MDRSDDRHCAMSLNGLPRALGDWIRAARRDSGLTQQEVALKVGITVRSVSGWESGKTIPHVETLEVLARVLGQEPRRFTVPAQAAMARRLSGRVEHVSGRIEGALGDMVRHLRVEA